MRKQKTTYARKDITLLCQEAVHPDEAVSKPAVQRLFSEVVETLCDSFLPARIALYDKVFAQVIEYCRHLPDGKAMDVLLEKFGLSDEHAMLARKKKIQKVQKFASVARKKIKKICILSRVTVGADVAVTGVVLSKLRRVFPGVPW